MTINFNKKIHFLILIIISVFLLNVSMSYASTEVFFKKTVTEIKKGDTFSVDLKISSDKTINVIDGIIVYDKDKLEIKTVNKDDSLLSLWVKEPIFNNNIGELNFVGGVPNGFKGGDGEILNITFFAKKDGQTLIGFKDIFSVLANDGKGTNINPWLKPMPLTIDKKYGNNMYYNIGAVLLIILSAIILLIKKKMIKKFLKRFNTNKIIPLVILAMCFLFPYKTNAATLSVSPASPTVSIGNIVSVKIYVNTENKSINNAEASIQFPIDMVEVVSITKSSSIFSLWVEEPSFSNNTGKITFNGGIPNPGFTGQSGYIASITFKAKKQGVASIIFTDGAVRENDGLGTDILTGKLGSVIQITTPIIKEEVKTPTKVTDKNNISGDIFNPTIRFNDIKGIIKLSDEKNISTIDYYTITIDGGINFSVTREQLIDYEYYLPILNEGNHGIDIIFFNKDGKYTKSTLSFVSPSISTPILSLSNNEITKNDSVVIMGKTNYPNSKVNVILELNNREIRRYIQTTGLDGSFSVTTDKIKEIGLISIWAENVLSDVVKSQPSERIYLKVNEGRFVKITMAIFYPLLWLLLIFIIVSILLVLIYLGWHKFFGLRKKFENESKQAALEIHKNMSLLKEDLKRQLESLEIIKVDRALNEREEAIFNEIKKNIDSVDVFIEQKLKNII